MLQRGTVLGYRYEIIEEIGSGGMATVYKAIDTKLNRNVAVKVLKAEYSSQKEFVDKFKAEAQAAAGLMHHNIVNVYDVGDEAGLYYIVMELVEGITLKSYIEKKIRLSYKEAVSIAIQVAMGIEAAHNSGIIHRDIKPQNIIISKEGKVKVADFGIARAATSNTITSHAMGSVHYTSPEQARGGYSDEKSDIYSIGITLFEMLTGHVPFDGETTVSIAIKQIQEEMPSPKLYVPDLPTCIEKIVFKCTQKNSDRRYAETAELVKDLKQSLITPDEDFVEIKDANSNGGTKIMKRHNEQSYEEDGIPVYEKREIEYFDDHDDDDAGMEIFNFIEEDFDDGEMNPFPKPVPTNEEVEQFSPVTEMDDDSEEAEEAYRRQLERERIRRERTNQKRQNRRSDRRQEKPRNERRSNRPNDEFEDDVDENIGGVISVFFAIAALVLALGAIVAVVSFSGLFGKKGSTSNGTVVTEGFVSAPNVVGMDINTAQSVLANAGLTAKASYGDSTQYDKDIICAQDIAPGTEIKKGSVLVLVISSGKVASGPEVPDVTGMIEAEARAKLEIDGFEMKIEHDFSDTVPEKKIISQMPLAGTVVESGSTVTVVISDGEETQESIVPDIIGKDKETAIEMLTEANLIYDTISEESNDSVAPNVVLSQTVQAGETVDIGTTVNFTISKGPAAFACSFSVGMPPNYMEGTEAFITLTDATNTQTIDNVKTSTFPYNLVKTGIQGFESGLITVTYTTVDGSMETTAPVAVVFAKE